MAALTFSQELYVCCSSEYIADGSTRQANTRAFGKLQVATWSRDAEGEGAWGFGVLSDTRDRSRSPSPTQQEPILFFFSRCHSEYTSWKISGLKSNLHTISGPLHTQCRVIYTNDFPEDTNSYLAKLERPRRTDSCSTGFSFAGVQIVVGGYLHTSCDNFARLRFVPAWTL